MVVTRNLSEVLWAVTFPPESEPTAGEKTTEGSLAVPGERLGLKGARRILSPPLLRPGACRQGGSLGPDPQDTRHKERKGLVEAFLRDGGPGNASLFHTGGSLVTHPVPI